MPDLYGQLTAEQRRLIDAANELHAARTAAERLLRRPATRAEITAALLRLRAAQEDAR